MPASKPPKSAQLAAIYDSLEDLLSSFAPPLEVFSRKVRNKRDMAIRVPKPVVIGKAYGGKPVHVDLAALILQKGYVGFYFMPAYIDPGLGKKLAPTLMKLLKGKTCFHVTKLDAAQIANIKFALEEGVKCYTQKGWL
jgi:hypothetical protein